MITVLLKFTIVVTVQSLPWRKLCSLFYHFYIAQYALYKNYSPYDMIMMFASVCTGRQ